MRKLKEILDEFGWDKVQEGQLPNEIKPERCDFVQGTHQYDLYALNGVCVVVEDEKQIVDLSGVAKTNFGYERRSEIPQNAVINIQNSPGFLDGFKHLYSFRNRFLFVRSEGMHFEGICKRMEDARELYHP